MDLLHGHSACSCRMFMKHGYTARTRNTDMQHGHTAWLLIMDMQLGHTARTCTMEIVPDMRSLGHEVVVVRRTINLGTGNFGEGIGRGEEGEVSLRVT